MDGGSAHPDLVERLHESAARAGLPAPAGADDDGLHHPITGTLYARAVGMSTWRLRTAHGWREVNPWSDPDDRLGAQLAAQARWLREAYGNAGPRPEPDRLALGTEHEEWSRQFDAEAELLRARVGPEVVAVEHIGSTAVTGLLSRPIVDVQVSMRRSPRLIGELRANLAGAGYIWRPSADPVDDDLPRYTRTGFDLRLCRAGSPVAPLAALFRNRLRADPELAGAYAELKRRLVDTDPYDIEGYTGAKARFIGQVLGGS